MVDTEDTPLKRLRLKRGLTQKALACEAGIEQAHLSALELGKIAAPEWATVRRLSRALKVKPEVLFPIPA